MRTDGDGSSSISVGLSRLFPLVTVVDDKKKDVGGDGGQQGPKVRVKGLGTVAGGN